MVPFALGRYATERSLAEPCRPRVIDSLPTTEDLVASLVLANCEGSATTEIRVARSSVMNNPNVTVWRADAGDHPELLHFVCGERVVPVRMAWAGHLLRVAHDRRAHVALEQLSTPAFGTTLATRPLDAGEEALEGLPEKSLRPRRCAAPRAP